MQLFLSSKKIFLFCVIALCLIFAGMQLYLSSHTMFTPDELWVAHSVYSKYRLYLPYRDFAPYKTVLGYYLFLIPLTLTQDPVTGLINLKIFLTIINTFLLFICSWWFTRFFSYSGILISLALLISTNFFMSFSADIRVDLMAYWCCLISVLLLLEKRFIYAGITLGIAFCISQKAIWYGVASDVALGMVWLLFQRQQKDLSHIIWFNLSFVLVITIYLSLWSSISGIQTVLDHVFYQAAIVYQIDLYQTPTNSMLYPIIKDNFFYLAFWLLSILSLLTHNKNTNFPRRIFIFTFGWTALILVIIYKQPFIYYTIAVFPPLFLLYADFISWLNSLLVYKVKSFITGRYLTYVFIVSFLSLAFFKIELLVLPPPLVWLSMILLLCAPMLLYVYLTNSLSSNYKFVGKLSLTCIYLIIIIGGVIIPQINNTSLFVKTGYQYQQLAMRVLNKLLKDDSTYIAGVDLLYNKNQVISGNTYLEQNLLFLDQPNPKLIKLLLPALDLDPNITIEKMIATINENPVKIFIHCPFMIRLPSFMEFIRSQYAYLWGNFYIYGPQIAAGEHTVSFKFSGLYTLLSDTSVLLDGKQILPNTNLKIEANKTYSSIANENYRLVLSADELPFLPKKYYSEVPQRLFSECTELFTNNKRRCVYFQVMPAKRNN